MSPDATPDAPVGRYTRRGLLTRGAAGGAVLGLAPLALGTSSAAADGSQHDGGQRDGQYKGAIPGGSFQPDDPVAMQIASIIGGMPNINHGVLQIDMTRADLGTKIGDITTLGFPTCPSFDGHHTFTFEPIPNNQVITNSVVALLESEIQNVVDALISQQLVMQAFHQHFYDQNPQLWHIHFRGIGAPTDIAQRVKNVVAATATKTSPPPPPSTPLPAQKLADILLGTAPTIGANGVVSTWIPRGDEIVLQDVAINPLLNVSPHASFQPLPTGGAVAFVDFSMEAESIMPVMEVMRSQGWDVACLYNQETDEYPQLFYSHQLKAGDPVTLAQEIVNGLAKTEVWWTRPGYAQAQHERSQQGNHSGHDNGGHRKSDHGQRRKGDRRRHEKGGHGHRR